MLGDATTSVQAYTPCLSRTGGTPMHLVVQPWATTTVPLNPLCQPCQPWQREARGRVPHKPYSDMTSKSLTFNTGLHRPLSSDGNRNNLRGGGKALQLQPLPIAERGTHSLYVGWTEGHGVGTAAVKSVE